jgi:prolyl-tRNA editing enzyme YbaK/EbsC (Cys-tRNA(Pro) deacylase)
MNFGKLEFTPVKENFELTAAVTAEFMQAHKLDALVAEIDESLSDTEAFCENYGIGLEVSANCVIVEAKRAERIWYAACMVAAADRADINGTIRKYLEARKVSFAPTAKAVELTGMEYGGITPIGLPAGWPILIDTKIAANDKNIIGSGIRKSKLLVSGKLLSELPNAVVIDLVKTV